jgi:Holliday junction resolvase
VGRMSRTKGASGEREICRVLRDAGWPEAARTSDGRSQHGRGDIAGVPGVVFEIRRTEKLNIWQAIDDVQRQAADGELPVVVFRRNRSGWWAAIPLERLVELLPAIALAHETREDGQ